MDGLSEFQRRDMMSRIDCSFEFMKKVSKRYHEGNPMSYMVFLNYNPRLTTEEKQYFLHVKNRLEREREIKK